METTLYTLRCIEEVMKRLSGPTTTIQYLVIFTWVGQNSRLLNLMVRVSMKINHSMSISPLEWLKISPGVRLKVFIFFWFRLVAYSKNCVVDMVDPQHLVLMVASHYLTSDLCVLLENYFSSDLLLILMRESFISYLKEATIHPLCVRLSLKKLSPDQAETLLECLETRKHEFLLRDEDYDHIRTYCQWLDEYTKSCIAVRDSLKRKRVDFWGIWTFVCDLIYNKHCCC